MCSIQIQVNKKIFFYFTLFKHILCVHCRIKTGNTKGLIMGLNKIHIKNVSILFSY